MDTGLTDGTYSIIVTLVGGRDRGATWRTIIWRRIKG